MGLKGRWFFCAVVAVGLLGQGSTSAAARRGPLCFGKRATQVGTPGADVLKGTLGRDVIVARGGDDEVVAYEGNDRVCGGPGQDNIDVQYGDDFVDGGPDDDDIDGGPGSDYLTGADGTDVVYGGIGDEESDTVVGGAGNDSLSIDGTARFSYLFGGDGADTMRGASIYPDYFFPGADEDHDQIFDGEDSDDDTVSYRLNDTGAVVDLDPPDTGSSGDPVVGDSFYDIENVEGSMFDDVIEGDDGNNHLIGHDGADTLMGFEGFDTIDPGLGDDTADGGEDPQPSGGDMLSFFWSPVGVDASLERGDVSGAGTDEIVGFEHLGGSEYSDRLEGDEGDNSLNGRGGSNVLIALAGDDWLYDASSGSDAGDGYDSCRDGEAENCESSSFFHPSTIPFVAYPDQAQVYGTTEVTGVTLTPGHEDAGISLRLITDSGCHWWSERINTLVLRPCGVPLFNNEISIEGPLPTGPYTAVAEITEVGWPHNFHQWPSVGFSIAEGE